MATQIHVKSVLLITAIPNSLSCPALATDIDVLSTFFGLKRMPIPIAFSQSRRSDCKSIGRIQ